MRRVHCGEVTHHNSTVLDYNWNAESWRGLRMAEGQRREKNTLMMVICGTTDVPRDLHLSVPYCHPDDHPYLSEGCGWYRVRPKSDRVFDVVNRNGKWWWIKR